MRNTWYLLSFCFILFLNFSACKNNTKQKDNVLAHEASFKKESNAKPKKELNPEFKEYWYAGEAEITSYQLTQARYGELREGNAVLVYVTEPFLANKQVKADKPNKDNIPVLKLNSTKNYLTGIYPYSIMSSSFYPVHDNSHALKISFSAQEWCGHVYGQINNKEEFEVMSHSYFENDADQNFKLQKSVLENEIWNKIRINPSNLPIGNLKMIPSIEYTRLSHKELKAYNVITSLESKKNSNYYSITYPELERNLTVQFSSKFPYYIEGWVETFNSGFGANKKKLISTAKKIKTIKTDYWNMHDNAHLHLRDSLKL
ncbi:hypothetical protein CLV91_1571 [Maribacter vaceletii]|uniref:Septum formation inhibitor Maf n=1 Tax=Maribacter vaceletii TaxID=1206816 RepID=A0A495E7F5_9FLAO|nr:septum formation inhibitor Maf [Maribacter vaceletii]RKR12860.1 hypothetical protein CLV91_1571 [Maribacter vaceletii]